MSESLGLGWPGGALGGRMSCRIYGLKPMPVTESQREDLVAIAWDVHSHTPLES